MLTKWLQKWARLYSLGRRELIQLSEDDYALYAEALCDLPPEQLDAACLKAEQTCEFFPKPAEIRRQIDQAESKGLQLKAEEAWDRVLETADWGHGFADFDAATQHAARVAGNLSHLDTYKDVVFARERFIAAYKRIHELGQAEHLLIDGGVKKIIRQLVADSEQPTRKALLPTVKPAARGPLAPDDPVRADFAALREKVSRPEPRPEPLSAEEWERRKRAESERFKRHLTEHPELRGSTQRAEEEPVLEIAR